MAQISYICGHCENTVRVTVSDQQHELTCPMCQASVRATGAVEDKGHIRRCLVCSSQDLFIRKDFPQRLGMSIVVLGFAASCIAWYYHQIVFTFCILFATALVDVVLYLLMGDVLECYRCQAQYRGIVSLKRHQPFALEVHERYRQQAARMDADSKNHISTSN